MSTRSALKNIVAAAATTLLAELLTSPRCPTRIQTSMLDAVGAECSANLSVELAGLLATLGPTYASLPHGISNRLPLLLWHLLSLPPPRASPAATASVKKTLVATLKAGPVEQRQQAIAVAIRPLQRACGVPLASPRPTHRRGTHGGSGGSAGSSGSAGDEDVAVAEGGTPFMLGSGRGKATDLPQALSAAGDRLPLSIALELLRAIGEGDKHDASPSLIAQLEPRLNLYSLATQLAETCWRLYADTPTGLAPDTVRFEPDEGT